MLKNILTAAVLSALLGACAATGSGNAFPARADQLSASAKRKKISLPTTMPTATLPTVR